MNFNLYSKYYDLLYSHKDYATETKYIQSLITKFKPNASQIIELGCGSGNHAQHFVNTNLHITGIELSQDMINLASKKNIRNFSPLKGDIRNFKLATKFDAAISLFHVISYLNSNEDILTCFSNVYNHLNKNGIFIFDVWYTPAVYWQKPEIRIKRIEDNNIKVTRISESYTDSIENIVNVNFELFIENKLNGKIINLNETHPMRHYSVPEIKLLANQTGFDLVHKEEFLTQNTPSENTWGVCFVLKKNEKKYPC